MDDFEGYEIYTISQQLGHSMTFYHCTTQPTIPNTYWWVCIASCDLVKLWLRSYLEYCSLLIHLLPKHILKLDVNPEKKPLVSYTKYPLRITLNHIWFCFILNLDPLSKNRREEHFVNVKLIKSFISGNYHPAMNSSVSLQPDNSLVIQSSRTNIGKRRPGVVGATLYSTHWLGISSDTDDL